MQVPMARPRVARGTTPPPQRSSGALFTYRGLVLLARIASTSSEVAGVISLQAATDAAIAARPMIAISRTMLFISVIP